MGGFDPMKSSKQSGHILNCFKAVIKDVVGGCEWVGMVEEHCHLCSGLVPTHLGLMWQ